MKSRRLSREWRRSTTSDPSMWSGNQRRWSIGETVSPPADGVPRPAATATIARMRRWSEVAEQVAATTKTSEKTAILAGYLASLDAEALPIAAVFLTGRAFAEGDQRTIGIGWAGITGAVLRVAGADGDALRRAYDRFSDVAAAVAAVLEEAGHAPPPDAEPTLAETRAIVRGHPAGVRRGGEGPAARGPVRPVGSAHRRGDREGALGRAPDRAPRGAARGGAREGVRPAAGCREARGDAHRRHRPDGDARP